MQRGFLAVGFLEGFTMKKMMRRLAAAALFAAVTGAAPRVWAQVDAAEAYKQGKSAFDTVQFDKARDLLVKASQTDPKNPEVFLLLGKAQYQLGHVDEAVTAWNATLKLAPNEPYAAQMLKALRGEVGDADATLAVVDALVNDGLHEPALITLGKLLNDKALTDSQRAKALLLKGGALLEIDRVGDVEAIVQELRIKYPQAADPEQTLLLQARARLRMGDRASEGVALLKKLSTEHPESQAGIAAEYELLKFDLGEAATAAKADALAKWVAAHPDHVMANPARMLLIRHFEHFYGANKAYPAAIAGTEALLKSPLSPASRLRVLRALGNFQTELALREIAMQTEAGKLAGGPMPKPLADAIATLAIITKEFPADSAWRSQANLAERLWNIGTASPWPARITELKPAYAWAVQIALPVVKANADVVTVDMAVKTITTIVNETSCVEHPESAALALLVNTDLLAAISTENPGWRGVAENQAGLLDKRATLEFAENLRAGKLVANAQLSPTQQRLIATLATIVGHSARQAPAAIEKLRESLRPWLNAGYYGVAEEAFDKLAVAVPEAQQRQVRLAIVRLWIQKALTDEQRLAASGLAELRKLDPSRVKALQSLYAMQGGVENSDPFLAQIRQEIDAIVNHYKQLKYFDVAEAAIREKAAPTNPQAEIYQQFELAVLADETARREIDVLLKQYKATDKLTLTGATTAAIAAYEKFLTDHPADPLAMRAAEAVFAIAGTFEQYTAYDVAAKIDREFSAFAAKNAVLAQSTPGNSSVAEKAAFAAVTVADVKARAAMTKSTARSTQENKGTPVPPTKISDEFAAAITAYKDFIKASPQSPFVSQAILRINAIALDFARLDAWGVADGIYASLLADKLATRDPERIEFCRGLTQIGKVMPDHAKEVLAALLSPQRGAVEGTSNGTFTRLDELSKQLEHGGLAGDKFDVKAKAKSSLAMLPATQPQAAPMTPPITASGASNSNDNGGTFVGAGGGFAGRVASSDARAKADGDALAAISQQESRRANQVAALRDHERFAYRELSANRQPAHQSNEANGPGQQAPPAVPVLSEEELARQQTALNAAYKIFQAIRSNHPDSPTTEQARGEIMVEIGYLRGIDQWQRAAAMGEQFLTDNPTDPQLPHLRLAIANDHLAWASKPLDARTTSQEMLAEVTKRFNAARAELARVTTDFPEERALIEDAQWRIATSFLTQARTVDAFSATLARGQFVRAAKELRRVANEYAQHPQIGAIPQMLWDISMELHNRSYHEEALSVWNVIAIDYPTHPLAQQAEVMAAQTYQAVLGRPLRAAEVYLEINFARGGNDADMQNAVFAIGADLKNQKRWIESLRVLENFVQSFPHHPQAGQALTMIGQIHQANDAWQDAIAAYRRVINEFPASGQWVQDAKWAIADCTINLSQWKEAVTAYEAYVAAFPKDGKIAEANRRIGILKDLANYQKLVDEKGPKAYDAQFQIAMIVNAQLGNWPKAVEEYQKVATNWPKSHLAADALHSLGLLYLQNGEVDEARTALRAVATSYPDSPYACDSLFQIGKSYEDEANRLGTVTRAVTLEMNKDVAQKRAYISSNNSLNLARKQNDFKVQELRKGGQKEEAELQMATNGGNFAQLNDATISIAADNANREQEDQTAGQLADRQDKINAALRKAVVVYAEAAKVPGGDKAGESLLHMAVIYNDRLGDKPQAMTTWLEIVRQFSGTAVAEEASWQIAQHYEKAGQYAEAVEAYKSFLRNYRRSPKAADAQFFIAENYEHLEQWISAMDQYTNYVQNFPEGGLIQKAKEQISFIKTYRL